MELDLQLFGGRGAASGVATATSMQDTYNQMATQKAKKPEAKKERVIANSESRREFIDRITGEKNTTSIGFFDADGKLLVEGEFRYRDDRFVYTNDKTVKSLERSAIKGKQIDGVVYNQDGGIFTEAEMRDFGRQGFNSLTLVKSSGASYVLQRTDKANDYSGLKFSEDYMKQYTKTYREISLSQGTMKKTLIDEKKRIYSYTETFANPVDRNLRDAKVNRSMRDWLRKNSGKYGYQYTEELNPQK